MFKESVSNGDAMQPSMRTSEGGAVQCNEVQATRISKPNFFFFIGRSAMGQRP